MPLDVIKAKCVPYLARGKPAKQLALANGDDYTIVATIGNIYRGIVQYYLLAGDAYRLHRLEWVMNTSMLKILVGTHRSSVSKATTNKAGSRHRTVTYLLRGAHRTRRQEASLPVRGSPDGEDRRRSLTASRSG